jgi:ATP-dependent Lon protease
LVKRGKKESKTVREVKPEGQGFQGSERKMPETVPVLPVRDVVVYPFMILPLFVGREKSIRAVEEALTRDRLIILVAQRNAEVEDPQSDEIHAIGTVAMVMRVLKMPDGRVKILVQGLARAQITEFLRKEPCFEARIVEILDDEVPAMGVELEALIRTVKEQVSKSASLGKQISPDILVIINSLDHPGRLADLVASHLHLEVEQGVQILEITNPVDRLQRISDFLLKELEILEVQQRIQVQAKEEIDKTQREYYLREQLRAIQKELGETDERQQEIEEFSTKIEKAKMPSQVAAEAKTQLNRLARMHPDAAEASVVRTYLDWLTELPWSKPGKGQGADPGVLGGPKAQEENEKSHSLFCGAARGRQDLLGTLHRAGVGAEVHSDITRRRTGRSGNPGPPANIHRSSSWQNYSGDQNRRDKQPRFHDGRGR